MTNSIGSIQGLPGHVEANSHLAVLDVFASQLNQPCNNHASLLAHGHVKYRTVKGTLDVHQFVVMFELKLFF